MSGEKRQYSLMTPSLAEGLVTHYYAKADKQRSLQMPLLLLALLLLTFDSLLKAGLPFIARRLGKTGAFSAFVLAAALTAPQAAHSQELALPKGAFEIQLAYIDTGSTALNAITEAGLKSMSNVLRRRTTVEPVDPVMVNPATDELGFYPIIYWAVPPNPKNLTQKVAENLRAYMEKGGMLVVDRRTDLGLSVAATRAILNKMLPLPLKALENDHVLNRSYYLLRGQTPGRADDTLWMDSTHRLARLIVGTHDWAGAWAYGPNGRPLRPVTPGGERQREQAYRFGVNLVMYALLGDYKADQLHVDTLLERMEDN